MKATPISNIYASFLPHARALIAQGKPNELIEAALPAVKNDRANNTCSAADRAEVTRLIIKATDQCVGLSDDKAAQSTHNGLCIIARLYERDPSLLTTIIQPAITPHTLKNYMEVAGFAEDTTQRLNKSPRDLMTRLGTLDERYLQANRDGKPQIKRQTLAKGTHPTSPRSPKNRFGALMSGLVQTHTHLAESGSAGFNNKTPETAGKRVRYGHQPLKHSLSDR